MNSSKSFDISKKRLHPMIYDGRTERHKQNNEQWQRQNESGFTKIRKNSDRRLK